jgi:hypothetical protein
LMAEPDRTWMSALAVGECGERESAGERVMKRKPSPAVQAVLATWDIRSENRPIVPNGASFFAKAGEMRVQSTRSMLLVFSGHTPIFTKERFS